MKIIIKKDYTDLSKEAAEIVKKAIQKKPNLVLGLAAGRTPVGMYQELIRAYQNGELDFSGVIAFNLDEYLGLSADHLQSYNYFIQKNFLNQININRQNCHMLDGMAKDGLTGSPRDIEKYCQEYEQEIKKAGGIDLQILGIGSNGHIGFNEPPHQTKFRCGGESGTFFNSKTHLVELAKSTIKDNSRFFERKKDVPKFAITMGVQTIFEAKNILLLASGLNKACVVVKSVEGLVTPQIPASILQKHPNTILILDEDAASKLKLYKKQTI